MYEEGYITQAERDEALDNFPEIKKRKVSEKYKGPTGYLIRAVQEELLALGFTEAEIEGGGLRIVSTFDKKAQASAVKAVKDEAPTTGMDGVRIGLAAVEPGTGEFIAMYGGADYLEDQFNNATMASQQAGSTFKPFGLAAATEDEIGLDTLWPGNSPTEIAGYEVNNYGDNSYGEQVTLLKGTEQSINTAYVAVENETGVQPVQDAALRAGIPQDTKGLGLEDPNLTFVLGTASPHTVDVAQSYATFAARGERAATTTIRSVSATDGTVLYERTEEPVRAFDQNTADVVNFALQSVVNNGTGGPARALGRPVAAKTGSTDEYRSAWFAGYVPQLASAVSFSKNDKNGNVLSLSGVGGQVQFFGSGYPARVWTAFMIGALAETPVEEFVVPADPPSGGGGFSPTADPHPDPDPRPRPRRPPRRRRRSPPPRRRPRSPRRRSRPRSPPRLSHRSQPTPRSRTPAAAGARARRRVPGPP